MSTTEQARAIAPKSQGHVNRRMFYDNTYLPAAALNYMQYQHEMNMAMLAQAYTPGILWGLGSKTHTTSREGAEKQYRLDTPPTTYTIHPGAAVLRNPASDERTLIRIPTELSVQLSDIQNKEDHLLILTYTPKQRGTVSLTDSNETKKEYDERTPVLQWWDDSVNTKPANPYCVLFAVTKENDEYYADFSSQYRQSAFHNAFPIGTIIPYSGSDWCDNKTIPGWYICDGKNGTPNLSEGFLMGATAVEPIGSLGGSNTVSAKDLLANHKHFNAGMTRSAGRHRHNIKLTYTGHDGNRDEIWLDYVAGVGNFYMPHKSKTKGRNGTVYTGNTEYRTSHSHTLEKTSLGGDLKEDTVATKSIDNRPFFYSVLYIMRRS